MKRLTLVIALLVFSSPAFADQCPTNSFELESASKECKIKRFCEALFRDFQNDLVMFYRYDLGIEKIGRNILVIEATKTQSHQYSVLSERKEGIIKDIYPKTAIYGVMCKK